MSDAAALTEHGRRELRYWRSPIVVWVVVLGVLAHLAGFFAFSIHLPAPSTATAPPAAIYYSDDATPLDAMMQEQSDLFDFEPLFLPTQRNVSIHLGWGDLVERTEPFAALPPKLIISESDFPAVLPDLPEPLEAPLEMLEQDTAGSFGAFGQLTGPQGVLSQRGGVLEIYREGERQALVRQELEAGLISESVDSLGRPQEWRLSVGEVGVVGRPLLIRGSGLESIDAAAAQYMNDNASQWGLEPGYYRIILGP